MPGSESQSSGGANDPDVLAQTLRENLDELSAVLAQVPPEALDARLDDDEWSVREVLLHVIHAERWLQPQPESVGEAVTGEEAQYLQRIHGHG